MKVAILLDRFHLRPWEVGRLTDRQIEELYFHPRDEHGALKPVLAEPEALEPERPLTLEERLAGIEALGAQLRLTSDNVTRLKEQLRAKFAEKGDDGQSVPEPVRR